MNPIEQLEAKVHEAERKLTEHCAERTALEARCNAAAAAIDTQLKPLQAECLRLAQAHDHSEKAEAVRIRRDQLVSQRGAAMKPLADLDRSGYGLHGKALRENLADLRERLDAARRQATFDGLSDAALEKCVKDARFKVQVALEERSSTRANLQHLHTKHAEAVEMVEIEGADVAEVAELAGQREALQADAFVRGKPADPQKLAAIDGRIKALNASLDRTKGQTAGARAALQTFEGRIVEQQRKIVEADERLQAAQTALSVAIADLRRRLTESQEAAHQAAMRGIDERLSTLAVVESGRQVDVAVL